MLANDIAAPLDLPPFDNSAVDGYAVRHGDLDAKAETRLKIAGRLFAGGAAAPPIQAGQAIRIFTGAPMPAGADTVFMQEDTREDGDSVIVPSGLKRGANRRLAGEDVRKGSIVLPAGRRLAAQDVALAAAVGLTRLKVRRRVRVALFSTGDEIVEPGTPRPDAALYDANRYLLGGMLERLGAQTTDLGILQDNPDVLAKAIAAAAKITTWCSPPAASRPAKRITCATRSRRSASCGSGASPSSRAGRSRWASCPAPATARRSSACRAIRSRRSSPSRAWCGRCCCGSAARRRSRSPRCR